MAPDRCPHCPVPADLPCRSDLLGWLCGYAARGPLEARHAVSRSAIAHRDAQSPRPASGAIPAPSSVRFDPMDCAWLGPPTGDLVECPTCSGTVKLKVFACQLFETTHSRQCAACHERLPRDQGPPPGLARSEATPQASPPDLPPAAFPPGAIDGGAG
jgi:hypothetical protein